MTEKPFGQHFSRPKIRLLKISLLFWSFVLALFAAMPSSANDPGFVIQSASLQKEDNEWRLNATIDYQLPEVTVEALNNGIPLTVTLQFKLKKIRPWLWSKTIFHKSLKFQLRYLGLAKLYQITDISQEQQFNFASFQAAIDHIGNLTVSPLKIPASVTPVANEKQYIGILKAQLEIEALPLPLRPVAYMTPQWHLSSEWFEWPLTK
jgi:hypothetical protein